MDKSSTAIQLPSPSCEQSNGTCYITYILLCVTTISNGVICTSTKNVELLGYLISLYVGCGLQYTLQFTKTTPYYYY